jgi:hypothetical protein
MRAAFNFRSIGLPFYMLCYANAPKWDFRRAISLSLLLGLMPRPNNAGTPLETMGKLWQILDYIPIERAQWHPFYEDGAIVSTDPWVKCSYYEYRDISGRTCRLIFCANTHDQQTSATISFKDKARQIRYLMGKQVEFGQGTASVTFDNFDYTVLYVESEN